MEIGLKKSNLVKKDELIDKCKILTQRVHMLKEVAMFNKPYSMIQENLEKLGNDKQEKNETQNSNDIDDLSSSKSKTENKKQNKDKNDKNTKN